MAVTRPIDTTLTRDSYHQHRERFPAPENSSSTLSSRGYHTPASRLSQVSNDDVHMLEVAPPPPPPPPLHQLPSPMRNGTIRPLSTEDLHGMSLSSELPNHSAFLKTRSSVMSESKERRQLLVREQDMIETQRPRRFGLRRPRGTTGRRKGLFHWRGRERCRVM